MRSINQSARVRDAFSHAFTEKATRMQEGIYQKYADQMVARMRSNGEGIESKVNIVDMYTFAVFDAIADFAFGEPLKLTETGAYTPWVRTIFDGLRFQALSGLFMKSIPAPFNNWMMRILLAPFKAKAEQHNKFSADMVDRRLERGRDEKDDPDIWSFVVQKQGKNKLSLGEMHGNAGITMVAGSETSATVLSALTFFLGQSPEAYRRVKTEIREAFERTEDITFTKLQTLEYMNACFNETFRLFPPAVFGLPRIVPNGGAEICSQHFPSDVRLFSPLLPLRADSEADNSIC